MTTTAPTTMTPRRRWLQFSLRTLMVLVLVLGCGMGWFAYELQQAQRQRDAVEAIRNLGGIVAYDYQVSASRLRRMPPPEWARRLVGDDFLANVVLVDSHSRRSVSERDHLQVLHVLPQAQSSAPRHAANLRRSRGWRSMTPFPGPSHAAFRMLYFALFKAKSKEANRMYVTAARIKARRFDPPRQRELTNVTAAQIGATIARSITRPSMNSSSLSGRLINEPSVSRIATAVRPTNRQPAKQGRAFWDRLSIWRCPLSLHHRAAAKSPNEFPRHVTFERPPG